MNTQTHDISGNDITEREIELERAGFVEYMSRNRQLAYISQCFERLDSSERQQLLEHTRELCDAEPFDMGGIA